MKHSSRPLFFEKRHHLEFYSCKLTQQLYSMYPQISRVQSLLINRSFSERSFVQPPYQCTMQYTQALGAAAAGYA